MIGFDINDSEKWQLFFNDNGFVVIDNLFDDSEIAVLRRELDQLVGNGSLNYVYDSLPPNSNNMELYSASPMMKGLASHEKIVSVIKRLLNTTVELQHAKLSLKAHGCKGLTEVKWHQDYPFYPHSNFDLIASSILLDDEDADNSPLRFLPGSHLLGLRDHYNGDTFAHECTDMPDFDPAEVIEVNAKAGAVIFHHCLTLHYSVASTGVKRHRRHLVYQYRAKDALQLAGVLRKSTGAQVDDSPPAKTVRFDIKDSLKMIGNRRKIYDPHGTLS